MSQVSSGAERWRMSEWEFHLVGLHFMLLASQSVIADQFSCLTFFYSLFLPSLSLSFSLTLSDVFASFPSPSSISSLIVVLKHESPNQSVKMAARIKHDKQRERERETNTFLLLAHTAILLLERNVALLGLRVQLLQFLSFSAALAAAPKSATSPNNYWLEGWLMTIPSLRSFLHSLSFLSLSFFLSLSEWRHLHPSLFLLLFLSLFIPSSLLFGFELSPLQMLPALFFSLSLSLSLFHQQQEWVSLYPCWTHRVLLLTLITKCLFYHTNYTLIAGLCLHGSWSAAPTLLLSSIHPSLPSFFILLIMHMIRREGEAEKEWEKNECDWNGWSEWGRARSPQTHVMRFLLLSLWSIIFVVKFVFVVG